MPSGKGWTRVKVGCGLMVLAVVALLSVGRAWSERALDRRVAALEAAIAAARSSAPPRAPVLVEHPGNAAEGYRLVERMFLEAFDGRAASTTELELALREIPAHVDEGAPETDAIVAVVERYGHLVEAGRDAVRSERCDWEHPYEEGMQAPSVPVLKALRLLSCLMYLEAHRTPDPGSSLRSALELVVLGHDRARHPTLVGAAMGCVVDHRGLRGVARALERGASRDDVAWALGALDALGPLDGRTNLLGERLASEVEIASAAGRPVAGSTRRARWNRALAGIYLAWDWGRYLELWERQVAALALPYPAREEAVWEVLRDVERSWAVMTQIVTPNLLETRRHLDTALAVHQVVRVLLAAALWRHDRGAWPATSEDLRDLLGGALPQDPFRPDGGPITLRVDGAALRAYSWGPDAVDGGGEGPAWGEDGAPDLVGVSSLPAGESR